MHRFMRLYLSPDGGQGGGTGQEPSGQQSTQQTQTQPAAGQAAQTIDYAKIQQMLDGTLAAKENTALKAYFSQQGQIGRAHV